MQLRHVGRASSHRTRLSRQVTHPVRRRLRSRFGLTEEPFGSLGNTLVDIELSDERVDRSAKV